MKEIVIATRNPKKLKEIKRLLRNSGVRMLSLNNFSRVPEVIEDGKTFKTNAEKKARIVSRFTKKFVLADDSGLEVTALGNKPGVRSSRYAGPKKVDKDNMLKLLETLKGKPKKQRSARFKCVVTMASSGKILKNIEGSCSGSIAYKMSGVSGFGYDPVFIPTGYKKSFSELGTGVKDRLSHRAKALRKAKKFILKYL